MTQTPLFPTAPHRAGFPLLPAGPLRAWETLPPLCGPGITVTRGDNTWCLSFQELQGLLTDELTPCLLTQEAVVLTPLTDGEVEARRERELKIPQRGSHRVPCGVWGLRESRPVFHPLPASVTAPSGRGGRTEETRSEEGGFGQARRGKAGPTCPLAQEA